MAALRTDERVIDCAERPAADHEESVEAIVGLHQQDAPHGEMLQRMIDRSSDFAGRPIFVLALILAIVAWLGWNVVVRADGGHPIDSPPFAWLELGLTLVALLLAAVIVATRRAVDASARPDKRAQIGEDNSAARRNEAGQSLDDRPRRRRIRKTCSARRSFQDS